MKIFLISDNLTLSSLDFDGTVISLTPLSRYYALNLYRPDLLLVESSWSGYRDKWKYGIASYPEEPKRNNSKLRNLVARARDKGIPTVFWNKEDGIHFERFIDSASLFDVVLTVDENCIPKYSERLGPNVKLGVMPFAVQTLIHHHQDQLPSLRRANFVGSYSHHIHSRRREWQDLMFEACEPLGLTVYDRNSDRKSANYRYPILPWLEVHKSIPYQKTADVYRNYMVSLNVNTVDDSPTMFSRRLIEIVACGGIAVSNPSPSVDRYFKDFVHVVHNQEECAELMRRIAKDGISKIDRERALAGADYVLKHHTWKHRLQQIADIVGI